MPFTSGSLTVRRLRLEAAPAESLARTATMAMRRHAFRPINVERGEAQAFGWVNPADLLATTWGWDDVCDAHLTWLAVRCDTKRVDARMRRARVAARIAHECRALGVERLTRQQRLAIEEAVQLAMLAETSAKTAITELVWDRNTGEVLIGAASSALCERISELFMATFDVRLVPSFPAIEAHRQMNAAGLVEGYVEASQAANQYAVNLGADPDMMSVLKTYGAVGPDFLTWLCVEAIHGSLPAPESEPGLVVRVLGPLVFDGEMGEAKRVGMTGEDAALSPEFVSALSAGKRLVRARLEVTAQDATWAFTLDAETMDLRGLKLPVPKVPDVAEMVSLRVQATQQLMHLVGQMYAAWLPCRCDKAYWKATVNAWKVGGGGPFGRPAQIDVEEDKPNFQEAASAALERARAERLQREEMERLAPAREFIESIQNDREVSWVKVECGGQSVTIKGGADKPSGYQRATQQGRQAFLADVALAANPYIKGQYRIAWAKGWNDEAAAQSALPEVARG